MYKVAKALHFIGLAMFLGSILGHITLGFLPGADDQAEAMLFARQAIAAATWALTVPGLALLVLTGVLMVVSGKLGFLRLRWLVLHQLLGLLIIVNAAVVLVPVGQELLGVAEAVRDGAGSREAFLALSGREAVFGALNVVLAVVTVFVAVLKPGRRKRRP